MPQYQNIASQTHYLFKYSGSNLVLASTQTLNNTEGDTYTL